ncbi:MAG: molybdenum ABC transporter ATP-binding protein, partial [Nitrospiria bacterium]
RPLGYVFQETSLFPHLSVRENLKYGFKRVPAHTRKISWEQAVSLLDVDVLLDRHPHSLSGGERQRAAIARALLTSPRLMLMDEPLAALDVKRKTEILPFFERMHEALGIPTLYVSHDTNEVVRLADHMVLLDAGKVQASGPIREMLGRMDLPLIHDHDAGSLIEAVVTGYDADYYLTRLAFCGGNFFIARQKLPLGKKLRLRVLARDVSLTLERQCSTSILNVFPVIVEASADEGRGQTMVRLDAGGTPLLARITQKSADALDIRPGKKMYAQVKSAALLE